MSARFTIDGSDALERRLAELCDRVVNRTLTVVPSRQIHAIVLGGGYGRGEGGVLRVDADAQPYNDLEFYVLLKSNDLLATRRYGTTIHELSEDLSKKEQIEIELKLLSLRKLQYSPVTMFYYDLVTGHRLVHGTDDWLGACEHHRAAHRIPLHEATRLLMNRSSGLLFASERLARADFTPADADFAGRNLAKAKLALGDVALTMRGQYHWSCRERQKRLRKLAAESRDENLASLLLLHEQGVHFKLHPTRTDRSRQELEAELNFLKDVARDLWLRLESRRLSACFPSIESYSVDSSEKCPEIKGIKNRLINFRTFGGRGLMDMRYPRERLLRSLPLLLWGDFHTHLSLIQLQLRTNATAFSGLTAAYENLWRIYN